MQEEEEFVYFKIWVKGRLAFTFEKEYWKDIVLK